MYGMFVYLFVCIYVCMYDCRRCATCASSSRRAMRRAFHCSSGLTSDAYRSFCAWCGTISKKETRPNASQVLPHLLYVCMYVCMWIDSFRYCSRCVCRPGSVGSLRVHIGRLFGAAVSRGRCSRIARLRAALPSALDQ